MSEATVSPEESTDTGESKTETATSTVTTGGETNETQDPGGQESSTEPAKEGEGKAPEAYEFTAPEGMEVDKSLVDAVSPVFKEMNLSQDQVGKLNEAYSQVMQAQAEKNRQAFTEQMDKWTKELKNDKDFGGDNFPKNAAKVTEFFNATLPDELKDEVKSLVDSTGLGTHPAFVKYFFHLANIFPVGEDRPGSGSAFSQKKSFEERAYPDG